MKMYFYYGVMGSSKTAIALMENFNFREHGKKVILIKPSIDNRDGKFMIKSRAGLSSEAVLISAENKFSDILKEVFEVIIVDESQFLNYKQVEELRNFANSGIVVMCYGLKTDYTGRLFEGSKRLIEISDTIREIPSMCSKCEKKAIINAKYKKNKIIYKGNNIEIGGNEKYISLCHKCWVKGKIQEKDF
ncbi:MAG: thymidine kinase [Candidatus Paraimprobicoccus trichonymphae]|uniref:Thymidine kinase n=1 Tax=Candidatus Paraimprobicoccus trichonymphae TaxID=3033793 RepID=A0AA48ICK6_9FIRM|nr:MAG: thymidine kinase [Candidatus Paraimprobicoccus trichonymphae]